MHSHILLRCWFQFKISEGGVRCDLSNARDLLTSQKVNIPWVLSTLRFDLVLLLLHTNVFRKVFIQELLGSQSHLKVSFLIKCDSQNTIKVCLNRTIKITIQCKLRKKLSDKRNTQRVEGFRSFLVHLHIKPILPQ